MRLLVSVSNAAEAAAAVAGGADIIDAKDPGAGALGAVTVGVLQEIRAAVRGVRPLTAAIGDAANADDAARLAERFAATGVDLVKIGVAGGVEAIIAAAVRAVVHDTASCGVVAVAYADRDEAGAGVTNAALIEIAARAGARGVLIDTADKSGPGLRRLVTPAALAAWVATAHRHGLIAAVAGQLTAADLPMVQASGADIAGVRGAACEGGRMGRVTSARVEALVARLTAGAAKSG